MFLVDSYSLVREKTLDLFDTELETVTEDEVIASRRVMEVLMVLKPSSLQNLFATRLSQMLISARLAVNKRRIVNLV